MDSIERYIGEGKLVETLFCKYRDKFLVNFDNSVYDNEALNRFFSGYDGYVEGNELRKYGIVNNEDGLLLVIALISDIVEQKASNWTI